VLASGRGVTCGGFSMTEMTRHELMEMSLMMGRASRRGGDFDPRRELKPYRRELYCQLYCHGDRERGIPPYNQTRAYLGAGYRPAGCRQNASRLHQCDDIRLRISWLQSISGVKTGPEALAAGALLTLVQANVEGDARTALMALQTLVKFKGLSGR
jgi:hypothetical protein